MDRAEYNRKRIVKHKCETDLIFFARHFFQLREGIKFKVNEHHRIIADTLQKIVDGELKNVIFNVAPGSSKTEMVVVNFIAQQLAINSRCRFLHVSYSDDLVLLNSSKVKDIILTPEYEELWHVGFKNDQNTKKLWVTKQNGKIMNGGMYAVQLGGAITGFRAGHMAPGFQGCIIVDDPLKVEDSFSLAKRDKANRAIRSTIKSRKASPATPIIMIMQRLHENDPTGFLLDGGTGDEWLHVKIPAIFEEDGHELSYWEEKEPLQELMKMRTADPFTFYGQYMQDPAPLGGGEFKKEFIQYYDSYNRDFTAEGMNVYILVDPANEKKKSSDYTAMVVWGLANDNNYYLLDIVRDKFNPTKRIRKLIQLHQKWNKLCGSPPTVGVEQYGMMTDSYYLQEEQKKINYRFPIVELGGKQAKEDRIRRLIPVWEAGRIYLPKKLPYTDYTNEEHELISEFIDDELLVFPVGKFDDVLDAAARIVDENLYASFPEIETYYLEAGQSYKDQVEGNFEKVSFMDW